MSDPIHYAPNFLMSDWDTFENWLTEHKSKTTKQAKAIATRERHLLFTADPKCRLMQYVIKTGPNAGTWVKGRKTAMLNNKGGHAGTTLRDQLSKVFKRDYLTSQEVSRLFEELFGDNARSKYKQAVTRKYVLSSTLSDRKVWRFCDVEAPSSVQQVRSLAARREMIDSLRKKYANRVCGATNDCRADDAFKCAEYHAEHSQILRLICEVRNDADLVAAQKELRLLRDEKIITFRNGAWYDKQSLEVAFPPTQTEVTRIEKTIKAAKPNRIQDINFEEFFDCYQNGLKCKHGLESMTECDECDFHAPFMDRFNTSEAVARKLCDQCEELELRIAEQKNREKQKKEREAQIEFEKLDKQIAQAWEDAKCKREEEQAHKAREQANIEALAREAKLNEKIAPQIAAIQPMFVEKPDRRRHEKAIYKAMRASVLEDGTFDAKHFADCFHGSGPMIVSAMKDYVKFSNLEGVFTTAVDNVA